MAEQAQQDQTAVKKPKQERKSKTAKKPRKLPPYNVVLLNDDEHTYEYVIEMLGSLFRYGRSKAYQLAKEVDQAGRVILLTTTKEHAELKRDQIHSFGPDKRIDRCKGSMSARIEPTGN
ncbi:MAG: ATP-dependent Clp protease adaptor ClpS [Bacillota bacterium]